MEIASPALIDVINEQYKLLWCNPNENIYKGYSGVRSEGPSGEAPHFPFRFTYVDGP